MAQTIQPTLKNRALFRNRNNISEMILAKQIQDYDREKSMIILNLDHDRLDMKVFLRQIKISKSDELPESLHWLQQRRVKKEHDVLPVRYTSPMPAIEKRSTEEPTKRDVHTAPEPDLSSSGKFRTRRSLQSDGRPTLYSIFSRRSELVDAGPIWQTISEVADEQDDEAGLSKPESDVGDPEGTRIADGAEDTTPPDKETASAQHREAGTDFMKELLVVNAEKRYRKKAKPIQDRLADYYRKLEEMKRRQAASEPTAWEIRRRYVLLTRGVKATLDLSDDSDDNGLETDANTPSIVKYGRHQHRN